MTQVKVFSSLYHIGLSTDELPIHLSSFEDRLRGPLTFDTCQSFLLFFVEVPRSSCHLLLAVVVVVDSANLGQRILILSAFDLRNAVSQ